ncbi:glycoside hydrolase [Polaribacter reichenbachii]|uniref:Glycoside hydrolase n=1 Tax=Polaribacter reichenbachii TaxID=996801 RepID=A0A1B8TV25_9FLAO|nr:glycosyl hydrolase family 28 protein [Polaribacter reichenbachii]APZ45561.1 glycoside hydrolase [Polaribacter reichenbachii]AUC19423.1 glycoside hydrolase [Polaribacter reichenbachii]OBY63422.1 glycoside hydrolase [Polaribacter reichenbachii]
MIKKAIVLFIFYLQFSVFATDFNVIKYGAKADGITKDTKAVQAAIDACTKNGGGKVIIPAGKTVVIGTIYLKDFVTLHIENGAILLGSPDYKDYTTDTHYNTYKNEHHMDRCLIFARNAKSFAIEGYGTINGNGSPKNFNRKKGNGRPMLLRFYKCNDIKIRNVNLINPAAWTSAWLYCNEIVVSGIKIVSNINHNGDGLDFDGCTNVRVSDSSFDNSDDSICLQTSNPDYPIKNVTVTNCIFKTKWGGMRIGLASRGNFESVTVSNCTFFDIKDSGLKIQMNEGGEMKNMTFTNLTMKNVPRPVFMTFCQQRAGVDAPQEMLPYKAMHSFIFSNFIVDNRELDKNSAFFLTGMPNHYIQDIQLNNIQFTVAGGGTKQDASNKIKEYTLETIGNWWPEFSKVGTLPAYGLYARHIEGLTVNNFQVNTITEDKRPTLVFDDVKDGYIENIYSNRKKITKKQFVNK